MAVDPWYEVADGKNLNQSDLICNIQIPRIATLKYPLPDNEELEFEAETLDVIVLTQTCDLVNDKLNDVLLARVYTYEDLTRGNDGNVRSSKYRKTLIDGNHPSNFLLSSHSGSPSMEWSIVDFHMIYSLPKHYVELVASETGPRLRLTPPYRESFSQAIGRYFMRVAMPNPGHDFKNFAPFGDSK